MGTRATEVVPARLRGRAARGRFFEAIFAHYRAAALKIGLPYTQGGAVTFVQRFGSLNLNVHFHVVALDPLRTEGALTIAEG